MINKFQSGTLVRKNSETWEPSDFDSWGRGEGVGIVVDAPFEVADLDVVDVRWPAGRCFEKINGLLIAEEGKTIQGFDPLGEPVLRNKQDGTIEITFEFMPPSWAEQVHRDELYKYDYFEHIIAAHIGAKVVRDDREVFVVQSSDPDVIEKLVTFLSGYRNGLHRRYIRIKRAPKYGDAPIEIRQKWIDLTLPLTELLPVQPQPMKFKQVLETGDVEIEFLAYRVDTIVALKILSQHDASASHWWHEYLGVKVAPGQALAFDVDCCVEVAVGSGEDILGNN